MSDSSIEVVEAYLGALKAKDLSKAPLAADVTFEDPLTPKLSGKEAVLAFLSNFLPACTRPPTRQLSCKISGAARRAMPGVRPLRERVTWKLRIYSLWYSVVGNSS